MAYNQQLSVFSQFSPNTTGTAGQVHVSGGNSSPSYWASAIPVSAYSAQFNGAASYITMPSIAAYSLTADFTIEAWIYCIDAGRTNDANKFGCVISQGISGATTNYWAFYLNIVGGVITSSTIDIGASSPAATISGLSISLNAWHHVAWVRSGSTITLYVDGVSVGTTTNATSLTYNSSGFIHVGHSVANYPGAYENWIKGFVSNVRIVKGLAVYTGTFTVPTSPLGTSQSAGTNISTVTPSQVSLLTCNGPGFTDSSPNAATITGYITTTSQFSPFSSFSAISRSATQTQTILTSGSGTYYTPSGVAWLRVRMVGGGGGGGGGSTTGSPGSGGSNGTNSTFGSSFLTAGYGLGALTGSIYMVAGGTASIGSGATGVTITGGSGTSGAYSTYPLSGSGGNSPFGGGGGGGGPTGGSLYVGGAGATNSGAGGGGGMSASSSLVWAGHGGSAGGYVEAYISSPAASYAYTVGAAGAGGAAGNAGGSNGGAGGSGIIIVEENYAVNASGGGGVLQVQSNYYTSATQLTSSGAMHELTSNLRVSITPKSATSIIHIEVYGTFVSPGSNNLQYAAIYDVTNSAYVNLPPANGSRIRAHWTKRTTAFDSNDFDTINFTISVPNTSTATRTYTLYHSTEGSVLQFLSSTLSTASGATYPLYMRVWEIAS